MAATPATTTKQTTSATSQPKPRIRRIAQHRYLVESRSQPGVGRQVDTLRLKCSCPAGRHGRRCWHLIWALEIEQWRTRQQQPAAAAPTAPTAAATAVPKRAEPVELSSYFE